MATADSIEITLDVEPNTPARNIDEGRFSLTVLARNRTARWLAVSPAVGTDPQRTFSFDVNGDNGATAGDLGAIDPSQTIFAPHETKRQVFDLMENTPTGAPAAHVLSVSFPEGKPATGFRVLHPEDRNNTATEPLTAAEVAGARELAVWLWGRRCRNP